MDFKVSTSEDVTKGPIQCRCLIFEVRGRGYERQMSMNRLWGCSSAGRAPALQAGGHRFDPVNLHHAGTPSREGAAAWPKGAMQ